MQGEFEKIPDTAVLEKKAATHAFIRHTIKVFSEIIQVDDYKEDEENDAGSSASERQDQ